MTGACAEGVGATGVRSSTHKFSHFHFRARNGSIPPMRIFFDTEFIEDGRTIDLISIGAVKENGETYYAISSEFDASKAGEWVVTNVLYPLEKNIERKSRSTIAAEMVEFAGPAPEFWAYYADYDWVVLCQLYGRMLDLPQGWPMFCRDIKQLCDDKGSPRLPKQESNEHNALADARWNKVAYDFLMSL